MPGTLSSALIGLITLTCFAQARNEHEKLGLPVPTRPLQWGDVNFLATSDTHGWLLGHQHATWPEPNYSGDYGDFASFATHMRGIASDKGADLLLADCGDHHDGSGLVSSSSIGAGRADEIFAHLEYDIMTIGNHELYSYDVARSIHEQAKGMGGRYLTSNVNITVEHQGEAISIPIGERYRKFKTGAGRKVTAFGVIFDFQAHDFNLTIQSPSALSRESWFIDTIAEAPDYFVLAGHMPVRGEGADWKPVYEAIRSRHPDVPIFMFGGHTHVRDCTQYDDRMIGVVPGRYMETVAFVSSDLPDKSAPQRSLIMNRRYLDANRISYQYHSQTNHSSFDTPLGKNITLQLMNLATSLNISTPLGKAPRDLYLARYPLGHTNSLLTEWNDHVLPLTLVDPTRKGKRIVIGNAGSLRFDLFAGRFDRNDELTISPFKSAFLFIRLPAGFARQITPEMNRAGASKFVPFTVAGTAQSLLNGQNREKVRYEDDQKIRKVYDDWLDEQARLYAEEQAISVDLRQDQVVFGGGEKALTPGYVTKDACPGKGDDIEHVPLPPSVQQPDFTQTPFPADTPDDEEIDVVVMDFALADFLTAVHTLLPNSSISPWDMELYAEGTSIDTLWGKYAGMQWQ